MGVVTVLAAEGAAKLTKAFISVGQTIADAVLNPLKELRAELPEAVGSALLSLLKMGGPAGIIGGMIGKALVGGIMSPLKGAGGGGNGNLHEATHGFVDGLIGSLTKKLEIHSPSELSRREVGKPTGRGVVEGVVDGLDDGIPAVASALDNMIPKSPPAQDKHGASDAANDNANARPIEIHVHIGTKEAAEAFKQPDVYAQFLRMIEEALKSAGIAVRK
jgi:hypothetical protein